MLHRSDAVSCSTRMFPLAAVALAFMAGCQELPRQAGSFPAGGASGAALPAVKQQDRSVVDRSDGGPAVERPSRPAGIRPNGLEGRSTNYESAGNDGSPIIQSAAIDDGPDASTEAESWFPAKSAVRGHSRAEVETLGKPRFARGFASPVSDEAPFFPSGDEEGLGSLTPAIGDPAAPCDDDGSPVAAGDSSVDAADPGTISFRDDLKQIPSMLWNDNLSLYNWRNAIILGAAAGGAVATRDNLDQRVRRETAEHPLRWGEGSKVLRQFGEYSLQVPVIAGVYGLSLWIEDEKLHEFSMAVISAYSLSAMYTVAIKGVTNTQRPTNEFQNGHYGFPSYHASSTFSIAAVVDEYYGWQAGIPAYVLAGLVGWSRIDQREHDLSDVLFGSVLGFVIGKTVAAAHIERNSNFRVTPYYDAGSRTSGVTVETKY